MLTRTERSRNEYTHCSPILHWTELTKLVKYAFANWIKSVETFFIIILLYAEIHRFPVYEFVDLYPILEELSILYTSYLPLFERSEAREMALRMTNMVAVHANLFRY